MFCAGVNIGALSVKTVALHGERKEARVALHGGRPVETLKEMLAEGVFADVAYFGVSGQLGHITEVAAIRRALRELNEEFDAVASLGGEAFLVYFLTHGRITNVLSHNKCAAGSGEFFVQQIGRMGLTLEDAIGLSLEGKVVPLASRCSVHCKSDITHKLNRKEASPADILHTLHDSMANKVAALLEKGQRSRRRVLLIGGVSRNAATLAALREKQPETEFVVPSGESLVRGLGHGPADPGRSPPSFSEIVDCAAAWPASAAPELCQTGPDHPRAAARAASGWPDGVGSGCGINHHQSCFAQSRHWRNRGFALFAHTGRPCGLAARLPAGLGRSSGQPPCWLDRQRPARPGKSSARTWARNMSSMRFPPTPPARGTSTTKWIRSWKLAARTPSTSIFAMASRSTTP